MPDLRPARPLSQCGAVAAPAFVALTVACFVTARHFGHHRQFGLAGYPLATGVLFATGFPLVGIGFSQTPGLVEIAGAVHRVTIVLGWAWLTVLAVRLLRPAGSPRPAIQPPPAHSP